jgi:hypothetical protein
LNYTSTANAEDSAKGTGGYVFDFHKVTYINEATNMTLAEVLEMPWNSQRAVAEVTLETVLYSHNYNTYTLMQSNLNFDATGNLETGLVLKSINLDQYKTPVFIFYWVLFFLFNIYYTSSFVRACLRQHRLLNPLDDKPTQEFGASKFKTKCLNFLGIDVKKLKGRPGYIIFILALVMITKAFLTTVKQILMAVYTYCCLSFFNLSELVSIVLRKAIIFYTFQVIIFEEFTINEDGTTD